jgi:hypothetical protein
MKKLEELAEAFLNAKEENRELALTMMSERERAEFLKFVGFYRLMTDEGYYNAVQESLSTTIYKEFNSCCIECKKINDCSETPKTNADKVRSLTDEELYRFIQVIEIEALLKGSAIAGEWLKWLKEDFNEELFLIH